MSTMLCSRKAEKVVQCRTLSSHEVTNRMQCTKQVKFVLLLPNMPWNISLLNIIWYCNWKHVKLASKMLQQKTIFMSATVDFCDNYSTSEEPSLIRLIYKRLQKWQTEYCVSWSSKLYYFRKQIYLATVANSAVYKSWNEYVQCSDTRFESDPLYYTLNATFNSVEQILWLYKNDNF